MVHLWKIERDNLVLDVEELLKYPILANVYRSDKSKDKFESKEYFKYIDFITNPRGHCYVTGLNEKESHEYSLRQTRLPEDYEFPKNNKDIIKFVNNELQFDPINTLVNGAIKSLNITIKTINNYVSHLNNIEEQDYKDTEGNPIDLTGIINKMMKISDEIPNNIKRFESLLAKQSEKGIITRGTTEYSDSMDGDDDVESYIPDET